MFDPTTRLQAARLHGEDLHRSAREHGGRRPAPRRSRPFGSALRIRAHHLVEALRSPAARAAGARASGVPSPALGPCAPGPRPALDR